LRREIKPGHNLQIKAAGFTFIARMEIEAAPHTYAAFRALMPYRQQPPAVWRFGGGFAVGIIIFLVKKCNLAMSDKRGILPGR
jgi:hypothetical protein